jgi:hypothetical protein
VKIEAQSSAEMGTKDQSYLAVCPAGQTRSKKRKATDHETSNRFDFRAVKHSVSDFPGNDRLGFKGFRKEDDRLLKEGPDLSKAATPVAVYVHEFEGI